jgi:nucleotide-binding universal stress UspA family protein
MEIRMSADRITQALQDYLRAEQYLSAERSQIDLATRQREAAQRDLESSLHSPEAISGHPLAATVEQVLSGSIDLAQAKERVKQYLHRGGAEGPAKPLVVVAVDGSKPSLWAVAAAGELALRLGSRVLLVNVLNPQELFKQQGYVPENYSFPLRESSLEMLRRSEKLLPSSIETATTIEAGDPAMMVAALSEERGADYIVIGTHGRGRVGQLLLGSTATAVARLAKCPVIVVSHAPASMPQLPQEKRFGERLLEKLNPAEVPLD